MKRDNIYNIGDEVIYNGRVTVIRELNDSDTYMVEASFEDYLKNGSLLELAGEGELYLYKSAKNEVLANHIEYDLIEDLDNIILN